MNNIKEMLSYRGELSHKRVLGTIGFICLIVFMFTSKSESNTSSAIDAVSYITIAYSLGTVAEKFIKKQDNDNVN